MERRKHSREFKIEAVRLSRERGVSLAQVSRDLEVHVNMLRKWVRELTADPASRRERVFTTRTARRLALISCSRAAFALLDL